MRLKNEHHQKTYEKYKFLSNLLITIENSLKITQKKRYF